MFAWKREKQSRPCVLSGGGDTTQVVVLLSETTLWSKKKKNPLCRLSALSIVKDDTLLLLELISLHEWKDGIKEEGDKAAGWGVRGWVIGSEVVVVEVVAAVCVCARLSDEAMEGVNPFLHHYLVSATALTLISLRAARPTTSPPLSLPPFLCPSFHLPPLTPPPTPRPLPSPLSSSDFLTSSVSPLHLRLCGKWLKYQEKKAPNPAISTAVLQPDMPAQAQRV